MARTSSIEQRTFASKKIGRVDPSPLGRPVQQDMWHQLAVTEQLLRHEESKTQPTVGRPAQQDVCQLVAVSSSQEQDACATKETRATVASLPEWDEDSSGVT